MINVYAKAVLAALAAFVATIQVKTPASTSEWIQAAVSGLGVGLVTWYVPNTTSGNAVIPPTQTVSQGKAPGS